MSLENPKENLEMQEPQIAYKNLQTLENLYGTFGKKTGKFFKHPHAINNYAYLFEKHFPNEIINVFERFPEIFFDTNLFKDVTYRISQGLNFRMLQDLFLRYYGNEHELLKILNLISEIRVYTSYTQCMGLIVALLNNPRSEAILSYEKFENLYQYLKQNNFFNNPKFFLDLTKYVSITYENLITLECKNLNGFKQEIIIDILDSHRSYVSFESLQKISNLDFINLIKLKEMMIKRRFDLEYMFFNDSFDQSVNLNDKINAVVHAVFMALA